MTAESSTSIGSGIRSMGAATAIRFVLQLGVAILLARLLSPGDFGLMAIAGAIVAVITVFQVMGTHTPIIQREELSDSLVTSVFYLNTGLGLLLGLGVAFAAPLLAALYQAPTVAPVLQVIALSLPVYALGGVSGALLRRRMAFVSLARISILAAVIYAAVAVVLALLGAGVWSLVFATLAAAVIESGGQLLAARWWPRAPFSWPELRGIIRFSSHVTGASFLSAFIQGAPALIIGRWVGPAGVGMYGMAARFTVEPVTRFLIPVIGPVMLPAFSRMQGDDAQTLRVMQRSVANTAFVVLPMMIGFAAVADLFVPVLLGDQWLPAVVVAWALAPAAALRAMVTTIGSVPLARGRSGLYFWLRAANIVALVGALVFAAPYGLTAVALAILAVDCARFLVETHVCGRTAGSHLFGVLGACPGPLAATASMLVLLAGFRWGAGFLGFADGALLTGSILVAVVGYTVAAPFFARASVEDLVEGLPPGLQGRVSSVLGRVYPA